MTTTFSLADLRQFTGTEQWYRHGLARNILFTDGAKYLADEAGAYWLLDEIAFAQKGIPVVAAESSRSGPCASHPRPLRRSHAKTEMAARCSRRQSNIRIFRCPRSPSGSPTT